MARIIEESVTIRFSKLVRNDADENDGLVSDENVAVIDATLQEVLDLQGGVVVEVERGS